ncbi:WhiB family transcriptional regulator [Nocardia sp. CA-290969]|uniref:WhiB family transcriptional regulator n=1 Tax=Nocardia sp. CA-290969 TaxID=3239986 RepID=UPI003D8DE351
MKPQVAIPDWRTDAQCRGGDPEHWFPVGHEITDDNKAAVITCRGCPVREDCARFANRIGAQGIWAGYRLPGQKDAFRRYLKQADAPTSPCAECGATIRHTGALRQTICSDCRNGMVDDSAARARIRELEQIIDHQTIAEFAGVNRHTISRIARGKTGGKVSVTIESKILALRAEGAVRA